MKLERFLPFITFLGFSVVILLFLAMSQKPLCIDSRVVERMDRIHLGKTESVYRCQVQRRVPYSQFWGESNISSRLSQSERFLEGIEPFKKRYQILIHPEKPYLYRIRGSQVFVGEKVILTEGQLERLMTSLWVYEKAQADIERPDLALESLVDFVMDLSRSQVVSPVNSLPVDKVSYAWPVILRSQKGYCDGTWSVPHHYQFCAELIESQLSPRSKSFVSLSLRPYIYGKLGQSYAELSLKQKNSVYKNMAKILRALDLKHPDLFFQKNVSDLTGSKKTVQSVADQIFRAGQIVGSTDIQAWGSYFKLKIAHDFRGDSAISAKVDTLFDFSELPPAAFQSRVSEINLWIKRNPELKVAVIGIDEVLFLPELSGVSLEQFGQLSSSVRVIESCKDIELTHLFELESYTENILLVQNCEAQKQLRYSPFLRGGVIDFAVSNKDVNYVLLHAPSFLSQQERLSQVPVLFDGLKKNQPGFASAFVWADVAYDDYTESLVPSATIEGLQRFRINQTSEQSHNQN